MVGGGLAFGGGLSVGGAMSAVAYCNLPIATHLLSAPGMVTFTESPDGSVQGSNLAASAAGLQGLSTTVSARIDIL